MLKKFIHVSGLIYAAFVILILSGCDNRCAVEKEREYDDVLLFYAAGNNSLSSFLRGDFNDLKKGYVPADGDGEDVLLAYVHLKTSDPSPALMRLYKNRQGVVVTDTLVVYDKGTVSSSAVQLGNVLGYVKDNFHAKKYGMIFSSHSTGWLPAGYYTHEDEYENGDFPKAGLFSVSGYPQPVPYKEPEYDPSLPLTKSIGQDAVGAASYEMELAEFASAIPMFMDYILFDTCLMGGIEIAYELRDVCGKIGFSQTEVLAEGYDYTTLTKHLFLNDSPRPEKVCEDFYLYYEALSGIEQSATISCVDCSRLEPLAEVCAKLFESYSASIASLDPKKVQRFYRSNYHWYYDLESILTEAGINVSELQELKDALDECVIYKAATRSFMGAFNITTFSGFSMFLPSDGGERLKEFYKTLEWNIATGLVR